MFLYTQGIKSSNPAIKVATEEVNYYEAISKEQTKFLNAVNEASVACYRELYFADGDKKIVTEGLKEYWNKFVTFLKKVRDNIIAFFKKWYNKIREFLSGKKESYRYRAIKDLIEDKEKAAKLANFSYEHDEPAYTYRPFFKSIDGTLQEELQFPEIEKMTDDQFLEMVRAVNKNSKRVDRMKDAWKGTPQMRFTLSDISLMYQDVIKLPDLIDKLRKDTEKSLEKSIKRVEAMTKSGTINYTPEFGNYIASYQTNTNNILKEAMITSTEIESSFDKLFAAFAEKAQGFLLQ